LNLLGGGVVVLLLNTHSPKPLYAQLKECLLADIEEGRYKGGQQLPTESELCDMYGVSRITARRAVSDLVDDGVLYRKQGKGTFVTGNKVETELISITGMSKWGQEIGRKHSTRVLSTGFVDADAKLAGFLNVPVGEKLFRLERLFYVDETPLILETAHYPIYKFPGFERLIGDSVSTHEVLRDKFNAVPTSHERIINVVLARPHDAELLDINPGDTLYEMHEVVYDQNEHPIHTSMMYLATDRVTLTLQRVYANPGGE
jgi:GntR family transcriptional regulator, frlABCD operon transcriptional regulator